jgi:hypothetical protein
MLNFANPLAFLFLLALIPVGFLYFLRMRFRRQPIGSAYIWRRVAGKNSGGNRLKWRSIALLLLQAAAVCLSALAAAGPSLETRRLDKPGVAFIIDASASMSARDGDGPSRLETAKRAAAAELEALPADTPAMVFSGSASLSAAWSGGRRSEGLAAISGIKQESGAFREDEAAVFLQAILAERQGAWSAVVFSDGGLELGGRRLASVFDDAITFRNTGRRLDDVGVYGLRLRSAAQGAAADFNLLNSGGQGVSVRARLERNGAELSSAMLELPSGESKASLPVPDGALPGGYRVSLEPGDGFALNDVSYLAQNEERPLAVMLAGKRDRYLEAVLEYRGISCVRLENPPKSLEGDDWDLVIANGVEIPAGWNCNLIAFDAFAPEALAKRGPPLSGYFVAAQTSHPLGRFLRWEDGTSCTGRALELGPGAEALATVDGKPVMAAWERDGYRYFSCSLDLEKSALGLSSAFPVLMRNIIQWAAPGMEGGSSFTQRVGEGAWHSEGQLFAVADKRVSVKRAGTRSFVSAQSPGLFPWRSAGRAGVLAANLPESEIDPEPRALAEVRDKPVLSSTYRSRSLPLVAWPISLLLVCLIAEWALWRGLPRFTRRPDRARSGKNDQ